MKRLLTRHNNIFHNSSAQAGKGDATRPYDSKKFIENFPITGGGHKIRWDATQHGAYFKKVYTTAR
jgi:hypothetical protein